MRTSLSATVALVLALALTGCGASTLKPADGDVPPPVVESSEPAPAPAEPAEPAEPAAPEYTISQTNAIASASQYLAIMGFSRASLIRQLEFEGYSTEDATFAVDTLAPDWNAEAAQSAQQYLDTMSFSRQGLYDQLAFEGFEPAQIEAGLAAVGY